MKKLKKSSALLVAFSLILFLSSMSLNVYAEEIDPEKNKWSGQWGGVNNTIDVRYAFPGDILYIGNKGGAIGEWHHNMLASGRPFYDQNKRTYDIAFIDSWPTGTNESVRKRSSAISWMREHDWAAVQYVNSGPSGSSAVEKAKNFSGKYAWLFTTYGSNSSWYCSKLVSRAYYDASDDGFRLGYRYPDDTYVDRNTKNLAFSIADGPHKDHAPAPQSLRLADFPLEVQERIKNAEENGIEIDLSVLHVSDGTNKPGFEKIIYNLLNDNRMTIKEVTERTGLDTAQIREIIGEQLFKKAQDNDGNELYNLLGRNE